MHEVQQLAKLKFQVVELQRLKVIGIKGRVRVKGELLLQQISSVKDVSVPHLISQPIRVL